MPRSEAAASTPQRANPKQPPAPASQWSPAAICAVLVAAAAIVLGVWQYIDSRPAPILPQATRLVDEAKVLMKQGRVAQAIPKLEAARELAPDFSTLHFLLGLCYQNSNNAHKAHESYTRCVSLPDDEGHLATCANNLGVILMRQNKYAEAEKFYLMSLEKKEWLQPHLNLGKIYWSMDDWNRSTHHYTKGNEIRPSDEIALHIATLLPKIYMSEENLQFHHQYYVTEVDKMWRRENITMENPLQNFETVFTYYLSYHGKNDVETYKKIADIAIRGHPSLLYVAEHAKEALAAPQLPAATRDPKEKIRVGFSSLYFKTHASAKMMRGVIENLDHDKFHIVVFALRERNDPPNPNQKDEFSMGIRNAAHKYVDLPKISLDHMRRVIEAEKLDVMVFAEIGMDPANYLLSFSRLAPVNVATHGHASTTGVPTIDYFVTYRPFEIAGAQAHYSEKLVTMPGFSYYYWPQRATKRYNATELGLLPGLPHVYACTQTLWKITPDFDEVFRQILLKDPKGQLVLKQYSPRGADYQGAKLRARLQKSLADVYDRVVVLSSLNTDKYLGLLNLADAVLDSYPFGGYTTSLECFGMGIPVVTLPHPMFAGRCTYGFYKLMNMTDLVAHTREEYVDLAVRLATDKAFNKEMRKTILARHGVLFESNSTFAAWNEFLEQAAKGQPVSYLHADADPSEFEGEINGDWPAA